MDGIGLVHTLSAVLVESHTHKGDELDRVERRQLLRGSMDVTLMTRKEVRDPDCPRHCRFLHSQLGDSPNAAADCNVLHATLQHICMDWRTVPAFWVGNHWMAPLHGVLVLYRQ